MDGVDGGLKLWRHLQSQSGEIGFELGHIAGPEQHRGNKGPGGHEFKRHLHHVNAEIPGPLAISGNRLSARGGIIAFGPEAQLGAGAFGLAAIQIFARQHALTQR